MQLPGRIINYRRMPFHVPCENRFVNTSSDSTVAAPNPGLDLGLLSSDYVEQLYSLYQNDADRVPAEWRSYFRSLQNGPTGTPQPAVATARTERPRTANRLVGDDAPTMAVPAKAPTPEPEKPGTVVLGTSAPPSAPDRTADGTRSVPATLAPPAVANGTADGTRSMPPTFGNGNGLVLLPEAGEEVQREPALAPTAGGRTRELHNFIRKQESVDLLIRNYRVRGHLIAKVDPLGIPRPMPPELEPKFWGLSEADLDRQFSTYSLAGSNTQTLRDIMDRLRNTYCGSISAQFMHIDDLDVREWLQRRMEESQNRLKLSRDEQIRILTRLTDAVIFEEFIRRKFVGAKSFSLEGAESLIPLLDLAIEKAVVAGHRVDRHGHGPPRPAQRPGQHHRQVSAGHLPRIRGHRSRAVSRRRRRQVSPGLLQRLRHFDGPQGPPLALLQSQPPGVRQPRGPGADARQAGPRRRPRATSGAWRS